MRGRGKLEGLIRCHRGIGLLLLCLMLYTAGSLKLEMSTVETGASGGAEKMQHLRKEEADSEKNAAEKTVRFTMEIPVGLDVKKLLELLKSSHRSIQIRMKSEKEGNSIWYLEFGE